MAHQELAFIIDESTGALTVEGLSEREARELTGELLPTPQMVNCARPINPPLLTLPAISKTPEAGAVQLFRIYHGSVCDGPGRRSVIQTAGCSLKCEACFIRETHPATAGKRVSITEAVATALAPEGRPRDGVTVTGGEPFDQPQALAAILKLLKDEGVHTIVYSGYTLEQLRARPEPEVAEALRLIDILIDGPFVARLSPGTTGWRGSSNQRIIHNPARQ